MTAEPTREPQESGDPRSASEFGELLAGYVETLNTTGFVDPDGVLQEHPELGPALLEDLETYVQFREELQGEGAPLGTLGDYTLTRQIGRGGMGIVYEAWEGSMDRQVALKVLPQAVAADSRTVTRFVREAQVAGKLHHPNVVSVHGMGVKEQTPYYTMEYVEGETLAQILGRLRATGEREEDRRTAFRSVSHLLAKNGNGNVFSVKPDAEEEAETSPLSRPSASEQVDLRFYADVATAFVGVADGLQHAHSHGVVHRDIKPSNLILEQDGRLRILDFGLARLEGQESLTMSGDMLGTVLYMSPEQAMAKRIPVDHRTDIYSLGTTLYEMLTWHPPFQGRNHQDTLSQIMFSDPRPPRQVSPRCPKDLETIVLKCLRKDPGDRYGTAEALAQDLRRFVRGDPIEARPQSRWEILKRRARRHRGALVAAVLTLLLVVAGGLLAAAWYQGRQEAKSEQYTSLVQEAVRIRELARFSGKNVRGITEAPDSDDKRYYVGDFPDAPDIRRVEQSLQRLDEAIALLPDRPEAYYHKALSLVLTGRNGDALPVLAQSRAVEPGFVPALALAGVLEGAAPAAPGLLDADGSAWLKAWQTAYQARKDGEWEQAIAAYYQLVGLERDRGDERFLGSAIEALLGRGITCLAVGEKAYYGDALQCFAIGQFLWPDAAEPTLLLGETLLHLEEPERAKSVFHELLEAPLADHDGAVGEIINIYEGFSLQKEALKWVDRIKSVTACEIKRAHLLCRLRLYEDALESSNLVIQHAPESKRGYELFGWASAWVRGPFDRTRELCEQAVDSNPENGYAWAALAQMDVLEGKYEAALEKFKTAIEVTPSDPRIRNKYARLLGRQGRREEHIAELEASLEIDPDCNPTLFYLGHAYSGAKRYEEALECWRKTQKLEPSVPKHPAMVAQALSMLGRREEALEWCQKALDLGPTDHGVHFAVGQVCENLGLLEKAVGHYEKAVALQSGNWDYHKFLGGALRSLGRLEDAAAAFSRTVELCPPWATPRMTLARLLSRTGHQAEAFQLFADGLALKPSHEKLHPRFLAFHRRQVESQDFSAQWDGLLERLDDPDPTPQLLATLATGCLHGAASRNPTRAREYATLAVEKSRRKNPDALAVLAEVQASEERYSEAVLTLEEALRLPKADWHLTGRLAELRELALPDLPSLDSVDAAINASQDDQELLESFLPLVRDPDDEKIAAYLKGRIHQRQGDAERAEVVYRKLLEGDVRSPLLTLRLAETLRSADRSSESEELLRASLAAGSSSRELWHLWLCVCLDDLEKVPNEMPADTSYAKDIAWLLPKLQACTAIRINCGGDEYRSANGEEWGADRFYLGDRASSSAIPIDGTDDDLLYQTGRSFSETERPAYSIPLPDGTYGVALHFAETTNYVPGMRVFDIVVEGEKIESGYDAAAGGWAMLDILRPDPVRVSDGSLEIEFLGRLRPPKIQAIEIERQ